MTNSKVFKQVFSKIFMEQNVFYEGPIVRIDGNCIWKSIAEKSFERENLKVNLYQLCMRCDGTREKAMELNCLAYKE